LPARLAVWDRARHEGDYERIPGVSCLKQNAFALAIGVVIGARHREGDRRHREDVLMPVVGLALPCGEWGAMPSSRWPARTRFKYARPRRPHHRLPDRGPGRVSRSHQGLPGQAGGALRPTKSCPECLEAIPVGARKCRACGSAVA